MNRTVFVLSKAIHRLAHQWRLGAVDAAYSEAEQRLRRGMDAEVRMLAVAVAEIRRLRSEAESAIAESPFAQEVIAELLLHHLDGLRPTQREHRCSCDGGVSPEPVTAHIR